jgi:hypothetical protein
MANTTVSSDLQVTKYLSDFFREYIRNSRFSRYTGTGSNNVITIKEDRKRIEVPLVTRLKGNGVSGSATLRGNGEAIGNYGLLLTPTYYRHAVEFDKEEMEKPNIDLMNAAKPLLMDWAKELQRDHIIEGMGAIYNGTTYANYGDSAAAANDTWLTNNSDRVLYGNAKSNQVAGDHTASLANCDTTNDTLDTGIISLAKRMAQQADPHIRPLKNTEDEEAYIMFCDPYAFRDLKSDSAIQQAQREGLQRGAKFQPLMTGGDLLWDNVIIREIPEIADFIDGTSGTNGVWGGNATADGLNTAGNSSTRVGVCFLCGQQALSYGLGQRPMTKVDRDYDYGFQPGVAVELKHEIRKSYFNDVQHGMVTVFVSAAADS